MSDFPTKQPIVQCPNCQGVGRLVNQRNEFVRCPTCQGAGSGVWWNKAAWSWEMLIDDGTIMERRMEHLVRGLLNTLLMLFVLFGGALGVREIFTAITDGVLMDVLVSRSWAMSAFWLGILCACYLGFRLEREVATRKKIPVSQEVPGMVDVWAAPPQDILSICSSRVLLVLERAWQNASRNGNQWLIPAHILEAMTHTPSVGSMLVRMGINPQELHQRLEAFTPPEKIKNAVPIPDAASRRLLAAAFWVAAENGQTSVDLVHLLAGFGQLEDKTRELLYDLKVDDRVLAEAVAWLEIQDDLRRRIHHYQTKASLKPKGAIDRGYTAAATPILNRYSSDLTAMARDGHLPYVVGREEEIKTIFRVIESNRHSVLLVGDTGVGKTSVLQALAERMATEEVPGVLEDKRLVSLSAAALVAGTGGAGQLEARVESIITEITRAGNIVLAIENMDQLVGASTSGGEGLDAAQIIAQAVDNRAFIAVATASTESYRRTLERGVIPSAFEKVAIDEMDAARSIRVLQSRVGGLEHKYDVFFSFAALDQAVTMSQRYLHDKTLPGKALELIEEAAVMARRARGRSALVVSEDIARIIGERTKIAVSDVTSDEQKKLLNLEETMHKRVVGQEEAVGAVANALRRARTELRDPKRPIANLLFLGPTGVGKTELAKTVAETYFGSEETMIRLDMSEYQEVGSINRLIGAPPGYGERAGGYLTDAVRATPYALVLLDEIEKAHPDILNVFLQVMDDGRLTDSLGRTIDFTNTIIIATSNAGTQQIQNRMREGVALADIKTEMTQEILQKYFRPEFLNRFDGIILFTPLSQEQIEKIVGLMIGQIAKRLMAKGITLQASPEAVKELARIGFDPSFGARPLRRAVQDRVDNALAQYLLLGKLSRRDIAVLEPGGTIRVEKAKQMV